MRTQFLNGIAIILLINSVCRAAFAESETLEANEPSSDHQEKPANGDVVCFPVGPNGESRICKNMPGFFRLLSSAMKQRRGAFSNTIDHMQAKRSELETTNDFESSGGEDEDSETQNASAGPNSRLPSSMDDYKTAKENLLMRTSFADALRPCKLSDSLNESGLRKRADISAKERRTDMGMRTTSTGRRIFIGFPMFDNVLYRNGN